MPPTRWRLIQRGSPKCSQCMNESRRHCQSPSYITNILFRTRHKQSHYQLPWPKNKIVHDCEHLPRFERDDTTAMNGWWLRKKTYGAFFWGNETHYISLQHFEKATIFVGLPESWRVFQTIFKIHSHLHCFSCKIKCACEICVFFSKANDRDRRCPASTEWKQLSSIYQ